MSTGSMRSPASSPGGSVVSVIYSSFASECLSSDIKEANVLGVAGDNASARVDVLAHQDGEQLVGGRRVVQRDLAQHPHGRVHRGLPQLLGIHLTQTLVALDAVFLVDLFAGLQSRIQQAVALAVVVGEFEIAPLTIQLVQLRLRQKQV